MLSTAWSPERGSQLGDRIVVVRSAIWEIVAPVARAVQYVLGGDYTVTWMLWAGHVYDTTEGLLLLTFVSNAHWIESPRFRWRRLRPPLSAATSDERSRRWHMSAGAKDGRINPPE
ncbi:hypothetical protein MRX96_032125 [Rhipicephalus microplus]